MHHIRQVSLYFAFLIFVVLLLACSSSTSSPKATATPAGPPLPTSTPRPTNTPQPTPAPITFEFEGRGDKVLGPFNLVEGIASLSASHSGSRNFVVSIISSGGDEVLSINEIGRYSGTRAHAVDSGSLFGLSPGQHRMQVQADGNWTIDIKQEFPTGGQSPPIMTSGNGDDVVRWMRLSDGQFVMSASHSGGRNFIVSLIEADGSPEVLLVNEIGDYQGEQIINVNRNSFGLNPVPGLYAIVVQADGAWEISIDP